MWDYIISRRDFLKSSFLGLASFTALKKIFPDLFEWDVKSIYPKTARYWKKVN
jgi:hypothetical protein